MKAHFVKMFSYNAWANELFLRCLENNPASNQKINLLFSHILNAEEVWLCRIQHKTAPNEDIWKEHSFVVLQEKVRQQSNKWNDFFEELEENDFHRNIVYQNSKGKEFTTGLGDILAHVVNHGTYHRAQVASHLRAEQVNPPVSDYIAYVRQK